MGFNHHRETKPSSKFVQKIITLNSLFYLFTWIQRQNISRTYRRLLVLIHSPKVQVTVSCKETLNLPARKAVPIQERTPNRNELNENDPTKAIYDTCSRKSLEVNNLLLRAWSFGHQPISKLTKRILSCTKTEQQRNQITYPWIFCAGEINQDTKNMRCFILSKTNQSGRNRRKILPFH